MRSAIIAGLMVPSVLLVPLMPSVWANEMTAPAPLAATPAEAPTSLGGGLVMAEEALQHVASADPLEREQGLYELGMLKSKEHLTRVTDALSDGEPDVRRAAIVAVRLILLKEAVPQLEALVKTSRHPEMREQALHELEALQADAVPALPTVMQAWRKDRDVRVRLGALEAMSATNDASAVPYLSRTLRSRRAEMRRSAAIGLGNLKQLAGPAVPQLIARVLADPDENVRVDAANALYQIGDARAVPVLLRALDDRADRVRVPAFKALEAWAQPGMETLLAPYLNRGRPHVRVYAATLLSKIGTPTALTLLKVRLARETHVRVKPALVDAITAIERRS